MHIYNELNDCIPFLEFQWRCHSKQLICNGCQDLCMIRTANKQKEPKCNLNTANIALTSNLYCLCQTLNGYMSDQTPECEAPDEQQHLPWFIISEFKELLSSSPKFHPSDRSLRC